MLHNFDILHQIFRVKKSAILILFTVSISMSYAQELPRYRCFSDHQDINGWLKSFHRGLDSNGIVTQNKKYSPLILSIYGLLAYDKFIETGDSAYYNAVVDQYQFFKDTNYCKITDNGKYMKLIYDYNFSDLRAPWHSGMTQGTAISMILRYYRLTKDSSALTTAQQLVNFMLLDEEDGGTITCTPENYCFIEEYPNSKRSRHVFNGFINGLIGLYEYLLFFENERAQMVFEDGYNAIFASIEKYDTPNWTSYNRSGKPIPEQYIRYQMSQFEHLYSIFGDDRFLDQIQIWGMMAFNRLDKSIKFYKKPNFQYATPLVKTEEGGVVSLKYSPIDPFYHCTPSNHYIQHDLFKGNELNLKFYEPIRIVAISFDKKVKPKKLSFDNIDKSIYEMERLSETGFKLIFSDSMPSELQMNYNVPKKKGVRVVDVNASCHSNYTNPHYVYVSSQPMSMQKGRTYKIQLEGINLSAYSIFYRYADSEDFNRTAKWHLDQKLKDLEFIAPGDGMVQFMLSVKTNDLPVFVDKFFISQE